MASPVWQVSQPSVCVHAYLDAYLEYKGQLLSSSRPYQRHVTDTYFQSQCHAVNRSRHICRIFHLASNVEYQQHISRQAVISSQYVLYHRLSCSCVNVME